MARASLFPRCPHADIQFGSARIFSGCILLMVPGTPWDGRLEQPDLGIHRSFLNLRGGGEHAGLCPQGERIGDWKGN